MPFTTTGWKSLLLTPVSHDCSIYVDPCIFIIDCSRNCTGLFPGDVLTCTSRKATKRCDGINNGYNLIRHTVLWNLYLCM